MDSIGRYSSAVYRLGQSIFNYKLKELELGSGQYTFFICIADNEGITQGEICDMLFVDKSTTAKAVKYMTDMGYVFGRQLANDKRYYSLYLTEKGRNAVDFVKAIVQEVSEMSSKDISKDEIDCTIRTLNKVINNLITEKVKYYGE